MKKVWVFSSALVALTACSGSATSGSSTSAAPDPVARSTVASNPAATRPATSASARKKPTTAADFVAAFKMAKLPIRVTIVYTAANDPNHLLGRPNGYIAKNAWSDQRIPRASVDGQSSDAIERGGSIETFSDPAGAQARRKYIQSILKSTPALGTEYDFVVGSNLIRLSDVLTPKQAQAYPDSLK